MDVFELLFFVFFVVLLSALFAKLYNVLRESTFYSSQMIVITFILGLFSWLITYSIGIVELPTKTGTGQLLFDVFIKLSSFVLVIIIFLTFFEFLTLYGRRVANPRRNRKK